MLSSEVKMGILCRPIPQSCRRSSFPRFQKWSNAEHYLDRLKIATDNGRIGFSGPKTAAVS